MLIEISNHAREQMAERGASEAEVILAIEKGESESARKNRKLFRKIFNSMETGGVDIII